MIYSLSKSTFIRYLQCEKSLFLYKFKKSEKDPVSAEQQLIFDTGHSVGDLANELFPNGISCEWEYAYAPEESLAKTKAAIENNAPVIYEASFLANDTLVALDIICKTENGWHGYEVKSSTMISEIFIRDAALQFQIIKAAGVELTGFSVVLLNRAYIKNGPLDIQSLFKIHDVYKQVLDKQKFVKLGIEGAINIIKKKEEPFMRIGAHCFEPYPCDFQGYCWKNFQQETIFQLEGMNDERKWEFFNKGLTDLKSIPDESLGIIERVTKRTLLAKTTHKENINISNYFEGLDERNTAYIEILTSRPAVPILNGTSPYQVIPSGFSMLFINGEGKPELFQYISENKWDQDLENGKEFMKSFFHTFIEKISPFHKIIGYQLGYILDEMLKGARQYAGKEFNIDKFLDVNKIFLNRWFWNGNQKIGMSMFDLTNLLRIEMKNREAMKGISLPVASKAYLSFLEKGEETGKKKSMDYLTFNVVAIYRTCLFLRQNLEITKKINV